MTEQQQRALAEGLRALAARTTGASASPRVEEAVLAELERMARPAGGTRAARPGAGWLAIAAALTLACVSGIWLSQRAVGREAPAKHEAGFVTIPGAAHLPPMESAAIVRVALPVTALPSYGIQIVPDMTAESVDADLLIAQDGVARAIRLVNDSQAADFRSTP